MDCNIFDNINHGSKLEIIGGLENDTCVHELQQRDAAIVIIYAYGVYEETVSNAVFKVTNVRAPFFFRTMGR